MDAMSKFIKLYINNNPDLCFRVYQRFISFIANLSYFILKTPP
jgi:hypothetical protein